MKRVDLLLICIHLRGYQVPFWLLLKLTWVRHKILWNHW